MTMADKNEESAQVVSNHIVVAGILASITSGIVGAVAFNWVDKAQYSSIKYNRSFFDGRNFKQPFQGTFNSISSKMISNGFYFYWIDSFQYHLQKWSNPSNSNNPNNSRLSQFQIEFMAGNSAGLLASTVSNPISAVKYRNWDKQKTTYQTSKQMWRDGGIKPFVKGIEYRAIRDVIFSTTYVVSRYYGKKHLGDTPMLFVTDNIAVILATSASSPANFAMNRQYARKPHEPYPRISQIYYHFLDELKAKSFATKWQKYQYIAKRFQIGVGNIRVALGITISQRIYDATKEFLSDTNLTVSGTENY